jgi:hypothetical protein
MATAVYASSKSGAIVVPAEAWSGGIASASLIGAFASLMPAVRARRRGRSEQSLFMRAGARQWSWRAVSFTPETGAGRKWTSEGDDPSHCCGRPGNLDAHAAAASRLKGARREARTLALRRRGVTDGRSWQAHMMSEVRRDGEFDHGGTASRVGDRATDATMKDCEDVLHRLVGRRRARRVPVFLARPEATDGGARRRVA